MNASISLKDVARLAGVSFKTVSNVVNQVEHVRPQTREKVLNAIRELGYRPNADARRLVLGARGGIGRSHSGLRIGCILRDQIAKYQSSYFTGVFAGIEAELKDRGHFLAFMESREELERNPLLFNALTGEAMLDGVISFVGTQERSFWNRLASAYPLVAIGGRGKELRVDADKSEGVRLAVEHLSGLGHRNLAFVGGGAADLETADMRPLAFLAELAARALPIEASWRGGIGFGFEVGYEEGKRLLALPRRPDAIVCASDLTAIGVVHALLSAGVAVPGEISVVGYDDIPEARLVHPPLTTIHVPLEELGREAVRLLLSRIADPGAPLAARLLPVGLIPRASTARKSATP
ncbi:MAG: LacI family DNA-binding transcriptional regulator [Spirochaetes bacterium]|nr:LacI family DNA-binding transcriptional regulator [Spirochaetota bacterium]